MKMILHSAKHPGQVNGVLLGQKNGAEIVVSDAIPLLHHWTSLSPMMEIGLDLVCYMNCETVTLMSEDMRIHSKQAGVVWQ